MARIDIPVTQIVVAGVEPPAQITGEPTENHKFNANDGEIFLEVENSDAAATHTVTLLTPGTSGGVAIEDPQLVIAKSAKELIGPFPPQTFNQSNGQVYVNVSHATLKLRAYRV